MTAPTVTVKRCPRCGETKSADGFHRNRAQSSGLATQCKDCRRDATRDYREDHREELNAKRCAYYDVHREEALAYRRAYREAYREEIRANDRDRNALLGNAARVRRQEITAKHATRRGRWSEAEDAYLAASTDRDVDDALELKRTYNSVQNRICDLRARGVTLARDAH